MEEISKYSGHSQKNKSEFLYNSFSKSHNFLTGENEFLLVLFPFLANVIQFDGDYINVMLLNIVELHKNSCTGGPSS